MGGKNSKEGKPTLKTRANHQARRRSSRIAHRDRKDYEEVEVLDDVKVKATVENDHIPDTINSISKLEKVYAKKIADTIVDDICLTDGDCTL